MENEVTETGGDAAPQRVGRRALLGAGVGGAALSLLPLLSGRASAGSTTTTSSAGESTTTEESTTSTTAPPKRPTDADVELLVAAQQLELTARTLYDKALGAKGWSAGELSVVATLREGHDAFAQALAGLLGRQAPGTVNESLLRSLTTKWAGAPVKLLAAAMSLESAAVATHGEILGKLQGTDAAVLIASIQVAEARHTTILADLAGLTDEADLLVDNEEDSLLGQG